MSRSKIAKRIGAMVIATSALVINHNATAAAVTGDTISNQASIVYDVAGQTQAAINSAATQADFVVDRAVNITVAATGDNQGCLRASLKSCPVHGATPLRSSTAILGPGRPHHLAFASALK